MYINKTTKKIVNDNDGYEDLEGIKYPRNFPKDEISELTKVIETIRPEDNDNEFVDGFTIDENYNQVWVIVQRGSEYIFDKWVNEMISSDVIMGRVIEDVISTFSTTQFAKLPKFTQDKFNEKISLRLEKPV